MNHSDLELLLTTEEQADLEQVSYDELNRMMSELINGGYDYGL